MTRRNRRDAFHWRLRAARRVRATARKHRIDLRVGLLLSGLSEAAIASQRRVIVERLERHGFVDGQNLRIEVRRGGYVRTEVRRCHRALIAWQPDVVLVDTSSFVARTREATGTIPIVFMGVADPVGAGLIKDFARPAGNATGVHFSHSRWAPSAWNRCVTCRRMPDA